MSLQVVVDFDVFKEICKYSSQYASYLIAHEKWVESMGYLFAKNPKQGDEEYHVDEAVGMASGSEMRVEIPPNELAQIENMLDQRTDKFLGGWWHTHPGLGLFYSETDVTNQIFYQQHNEQGLGIVFDLTLVSEDFIGFKIFRLDSKDSKSYHEVSYKLKGFSLSLLKKAFGHLGPLPDYLIHNLSVNLGLIDEPLFDLEEIRVPDSSNPMKDASNYYGRAKVNQVRRNFTDAIMNMRIAAALYEDTEKYELALDSYLFAVDYAIAANKPDVGFKIIDLMHPFIDDDLGDQQSYYQAELKHKLALLYVHIGNLALAEINLKDCLTLYDDGEDIEEYLNASELRADLLEKMHHNSGAIDAYRLVIQYAKDIRNSEYVEDIEDFDERISSFESKIEELKAQIKKDGLTRII